MFQIFIVMVIADFFQNFYGNGDHWSLDIMHFLCCNRPLGKNQFYN
jgi:hypothetical protein